MKGFTIQICSLVRDFTKIPLKDVSSSGAQLIFQYLQFLISVMSTTSEGHLTQLERLSVFEKLGAGC